MFLSLGIERPLIYVDFSRGVLADLPRELKTLSFSSLEIRLEAADVLDVCVLLLYPKNRENARVSRIS